ncbi:hypothetical protein ABZQ86_26095 [Pseudomonas aeruginosa]
MSEVCAKHVKTPAFIYGACIGCELEGLRAEAQALREEVAALRARVVDDPDGDFRGWFEGWALETEHPVFGYIGADWLDQGDAPNTYGNEYIQGAWVMAQRLRETVPVVQDERARFEKHCMSLGWEARHLKRKADRPDVYDDWSIQPLWLAWQARARLNGLTVSEGLLRRVCAEQPATCCMDDEMSWRRDRDSALIELRALLNEEKEHE